MDRVGESLQSVSFERIGRNARQCVEFIPFKQFEHLVQASVQALASIAVSPVFCSTFDRSIGRCPSLPSESSVTCPPYYASLHHSPPKATSHASHASRDALGLDVPMLNFV